MAHVKVNEAQQAGAFNNGAVGQQSHALCPYPYVWDRVRKACVLPDEFAQVRTYMDRVPMWNWLSYLDWPGALPTRYSGMGATCPEGSSTNPSYTGPLDPAGSGCRCASGRVWHNGYCQSPQSVVQQESASIADYASMSVAEQMAQPLSDYAKKYFQQTRHTVSCKLVYPSPVPGMPSHPTNMCSIDGGPYEHGAYAINLNPGTAIISAARNVAVEQVAQSTGVAPGAVYSVEGGQEAVTKAVKQQEATMWDQVVAALTPPPAVTDTGAPGTGIGPPPPPAGSQPTGDGGYTLPDGTYAAPGTYAADGGILGALGDIPWWVWAGAAVGGYMVMKKK